MHVIVHVCIFLSLGAVSKPRGCYIYMYVYLRTSVYFLSLGLINVSGLFEF